MGIPSEVFWPGLAVGLLVMSLGIGAIALTLASDNPSFAVEDDYYQRALEWDALAADRRASEALGWTLVVEVGAPVAESGGREIRVRLYDRQRRPITGAAVTIEVFAHARAGDRATPALEAMDDGSHAGVFHPGVSGLWEFRVRATRGDDRFVGAQEQLLIFDRGA